MIQYIKHLESIILFQNQEKKTKGKKSLLPSIISQLLKVL